MLKRKLLLVLAAVSLFFAVSCGGGGDEVPDVPETDPNVLTEDMDVTADLADKDLAGHTITVKGSVTLTNVKNGNIDIDGAVGSGTVTVANGKGLNMTVKSNANIVLDANTELRTLVIKNAARKATVTSTKAIAAKAARAAGREADPADGTGEPAIADLQVEAEADVVLEGGNVDEATLLADTTKDEEADIIITTDSTANVKDMYNVDEKGNKKNLKLTEDTSYTGKGSKVKIENRRADALIREIVRIKDGVWMGLEWNEAAAWNPDRERVFDDDFTYEFLDANKKYELVIRYYKPMYVDSNGNYSYEKLLVSSNSVEVTPKKGSELYVTMPAGAALKVENGVIKWTGGKPLASVNSSRYGTPYIGYELYSKSGDDWNWIGNFDARGEAANTWADIDIYENFSINNLDRLNSDGTVFVFAKYKYAGFSWDITTSNEIKFAKDYYPQISDPGTDNIIRFTKGADAKVLKDKVNGYYLWAYAGKKGAYVAYSGRPAAGKTIDLTAIVESNPEFKQAIKDNNDLYSFSLAWYKEVSVTDQNGTRKENQYVAEIAKKENLHYTAKAGYNPAKLTIAANNASLKVTPPDANLLALYKGMAGNDGYVQIEIFDDNGKYLWVADEYKNDEFNFPLSSFTTEKTITTAFADVLVFVSGNLNKATNKYKLEATLKKGDGGWVAKIAEATGTFNTTGYERPKISIVDNEIVLMQVPGTELVKWLKAKGADKITFSIYNTNSFDEQYNIRACELALDGLKVVKSTVDLADAFADINNWDDSVKTPRIAAIKAIKNNKVWIDINYKTSGTPAKYFYQELGAGLAEYEIDLAAMNLTFLD